MIQIAPSILSADFARLGEEVALIEEGGADMIHVDIMDGHFVPNLTIGPPVVAAIKERTNLPLDVHLMIENPKNYIDEFIDAGANLISVHVEAEYHLHRLMQQIKARGIEAGVALNPSTPINVLDEIISQTDFVVIMSVNPGFGGQKFIPESIEKVKKLKQLIEKNEAEVEIQVDGGVNDQNVRDLTSAGATIFVAGSFVFGADDPAAAINSIKRAAKT